MLLQAKDASAHRLGNPRLALLPLLNENSPCYYAHHQDMHSLMLTQAYHYSLSSLKGQQAFASGGIHPLSRYKQEHRHKLLIRSQEHLG